MERRVQVFVGIYEGKNHLGDRDIDGRIILRYLQEVGCGGMDWIDVAQERDRWRALVNAVMKLRVP